MNCPSKDHVKRELEKGEYRTCEKSSRTTAKWWDNFRRIEDDYYNIVPYVQYIRCKQLLAYDPMLTGTRSISFHAPVFLIVGASFINKVPMVRENFKKYFVWHFAEKNKVPECHFVK